METITSDPYQITEAIDRAWEEYIVHELGSLPQKRPYTYASSYEPCLRKQVLLMTDGDRLPPFEPQVLAKFHRGNDRERNLKVDLARVGQRCTPPFEVTGQQERFELRNRDGAVVIAGRYDCRLQFSREIRPPLEIKDWSENLTAGIRTFEDTFRNRWTRKGAFQLLMYLLGSGEPYGFLLLGKSGLPCLLPVVLEDHLPAAEEFLAQAEAAMMHRIAGSVPDYTDDREECKICGFFGAVCNPPLPGGEGVTVISDEGLIQQIDRFVALGPVHEEYEALEAEVRSRLRGVELGLAGNVLVKGKWSKNTTYPLPEEVKKAIQVLKDPYRKTEEKGKFTLKFSRF